MPLMVRETMDAAFLPQTEMADKLKVSQQTISNWLNGTRNPRMKNMPDLLKLAQDAGLQIRNYEANPVFDRFSAYLQKYKGKEFMRILNLYTRMSRADRKKIIRYAEKRAKTK